jgi:PAS domain S-box-containing protein
VELSADYFRLLVASIQDYAIYLLDPRGNILSWNVGATQLKGYEAGEIIGQNFRVFFTPDDIAARKPEQLLSLALRDGHHEDIGWRCRKDGTRFWASAVITALYDADGTHFGFAKVTRDLTDRAYRAFVETTHSILWTLDPEGRPNADSPSWRKLTGQDVQSWLSGTRSWEAVHPDDRETFFAHFREASRAGTSFHVEQRVQTSAGSYVWLELRAIPFRNVDGTIREWFGVALDISERKRAQEENERSTELLRTTLASIGDAVIATDVKGRVTFMNEVAERLTGWSSEGAAGHHLPEVFPITNEETGEPVENPVEKVLREGVVVGLANHTVLRRRDGAQTPIDDSAAPIRMRTGALHGVVLVFRDASEEKRALSRRAFLARAGEDIAAASDYRDALRQIAKLAHPRMADRACVALVNPTSGKLETIAVEPSGDDSTEAAAAEVVSTGRAELTPQRVIVPLRGRDGVFGVLTLTFAGSDRRYTAEDLELAEELAGRVSLLVERRRLQEDAERANRMKDEFLATISHELRTPLQAILGYATMLQRGEVADPGKAIDTIKRNAEAQARLVEDMLDMSRIMSGKLSLERGPVDVEATVRAAMDSIRPVATSRGVEIVELIGPDVGVVEGDAERIQQVVWNLASNAVKFTKPGGRVEVAATRDGVTIEIAVRDTGRGIEAKHLGTIFDRFRQVDSSSTRSHSGLGLGLAIVKHLVEAHGGFVRAESDGLGFGARFIVTLPVRDDGHDLSSLRTRTPQSLTTLEDIRVLLVDDSDDVRQSIAGALRAVGAVVDEADSAADALQKFARSIPDVIVSDIAMPGEDGYSLMQRIRQLPAERGGRVPAIAVTAFVQRQDTAAASVAGFQAHVRKPIVGTSLVAAIRACLDASSGSDR